MYDLLPYINILNYLLTYLNRVPVLAGGKGRILTSAGCCEMPYGMGVSRSGEAKLLLTAIHCLLYFSYFTSLCQSTSYN